MIVQNKQNDIESLDKLAREKYENIFNVYTKTNGDTQYYFFNILKKISIDTDNIDPNVFKYVKLNRRIPWTTISYQEYRTQHLWWLILITNNITNPVLLPKIGDVLKIIRREYVSDILDAING
jgi:hypothetical protein